MVDAPVIEVSDELLSTQDVADELGVSRPTVCAWAWQRRLPARQTPLGLLFRRVDVDRFKAERKRRPA